MKRFVLACTVIVILEAAPDSTIGPASAAETKVANPDPDRRKQLLNGYRRYHAGCNHCHGPDGLGSSFGPSLVESPPDPDRFREAVRDGIKGARGVM